MKKKILVFVARYLPGYKSGGPIRSISNLVESLGGEFDFYVVTSDRDAGEDRPYPSIRRSSWTEVGNARVLYLPPESLGPRFCFAWSRPKKLIICTLTLSSADHSQYFLCWLVQRELADKSGWFWLREGNLRPARWV